MGGEKDVVVMRVVSGADVVTLSVGYAMEQSGGGEGVLMTLCLQCDKD